MKSFFYILFLFVLNIKLFADGGIWQAYFVYNNGSGNIYINADNLNGMQFDNLSLSTFILKGGEIKIWKCNPTDVTSGRMVWRLYRADQTPNSFLPINFLWRENLWTGCDNNDQRWDEVNQNINIFSMITSPGVWVLEVYYEITITNPNGFRYYNNNGNNYKVYITFYNKTVKDGNWSDPTVWLYGKPNYFEPVFITHNIILDENAKAYKIIVDGLGNEIEFNSNDNIKLEFNNPYNYGLMSFIERNGAKVYGNTNSEVIFDGNAEMNIFYTFNTIIKNGGLNPYNSRFYYSNLEIQTGGYLMDYPNYDEESSLVYNTGGSYNRYNEWKVNTVSGKGVPYNVIIKGGTNLNLNTNEEIYIIANLEIEQGATLRMSYTSTKSLIVGGSVYIHGSYYFSGEIGGDLKLKGDLVKTTTGYIHWGDGEPSTDKGRAVFFIGNGEQYIIGVDKIPFVLIENNARVVLYDSDLVIDGNGVQFLTIRNNGILDLNGYTISCLANGRIEVDATSGNILKLITSSRAGGRIVFNGLSNGVIYSINGGRLKIDSLVTIAVEGGTIDFGNGLTDLWGTVEIRGQASIANNNYPIYKPGSTLKYVNIANVLTSAEWPNTNGPTNIWFASPNNSQIILNENKTISGKLIYQSGQLNLNNFELNYEYNSTLEYLLPANSTYYINENSSAEWASSVFNIVIESGNIVLNDFRKTNNDLILLSNTTLSLAPINGQLTVGGNLQLWPNSTLTVKCNYSSEPTGSIIVNGSILNQGQMLYERFVEGGHYTFLTTPNTNTYTTLFTNNPNGYYNPNIYTYDETYDAVPDPENSLYEQWRNPSNGFDNAWLSAENTLMSNPGQGYAYYNDIDRLFVFNGTFNNDYYNVPISFTINDGNDAYFDGWNLVANPYPCAYNSEVLFSNNTISIEPAVYYWDGTYQHLGNYKYYNYSPYDDGTNCVNGGSPVIPALQGFFVKAKLNVEPPSKNSFLFFSREGRVHDKQYNFWKGGKKSIFYRLELVDADYSDEIVVRFIEEGKKQKDDYDVYKMYTYNTSQIYSYLTLCGPGFALNSYGLTDILDSVYLGIVAHSPKTLKIHLKEYNLPNYYLILHDAYLSLKQNLTLNSTYSFQFSGQDVRDRFALTLEKNLSPYGPDSLFYSLTCKDYINFDIPKDLFYDLNTDDYFYFDIDNDSLPRWLKFDKENLKIIGQALEAGKFFLPLYAVDALGAKKKTILVFSIESLEPIVDILSPVLADNSVFLQAQIVENGCSKIISKGFCISNFPIFDTLNSTVIRLENGFELNYMLNQPGVYYFRAFVLTDKHFVFSNQVSIDYFVVNNSIVNQKVFLAPNPFDEFLFISNAQNCLIEFFNVQGQCFYKFFNVDELLRVNTTDFKPGMYFVKISSNNKVTLIKLVKR